VDRRSSKSSARTARRIRVGEQDLTLLWFLAEHKFVLPDHAAALLGVKAETAEARLARLVKAGYARKEPLFRTQPVMHLIARDGLRVIGSALPTPRIDVRSYEHDVGVAWLWIAARAGTFGPLREILGERRLRSHDGAPDRSPDALDPPPEPLAVKLGGIGPRGGERLHYPDLLLRTADGRRIALELELSSKGRVRLEKILAGYAADPRIDGVVYLVENATVARSVQAAARRLGISSLVHVQRVRSSVSSPAAARALGTGRTAPRRPGPSSEAAR
jgi:hypothetical protein